MKPEAIKAHIGTKASINLRTPNCAARTWAQFSDVLTVMCQIQTEAGERELKVIVSRNFKYGEAKGVTVELDKSLEQERRIGIKRMTDVKRLRELALQTAQDHWGMFAPTEEQLAQCGGFITLRTENHWNSVVVHADLRSMPYAGYKFWGVCDYVADVNGTLTPARESDAHTLFNCDPEMVLQEEDETTRRQNRHGVVFLRKWDNCDQRDHVPQHVQHEIAAKILPYVQSLAAVNLADQVQEQNRLRAAQTIENAEECVTNELWALRHSLQGMHRAHAKLRELDPGFKPSADFSEIEALLAKMKY